MLVINPEECIDCGVCEPECPEDAIVPDTDEHGAKWVEFNGKWSKEWAVLTEKKDPMTNHEQHSGEEGKVEKSIFLGKKILLFVCDYSVTQS